MSCQHSLPHFDLDFVPFHLVYVLFNYYVHITACKCNKHTHIAFCRHCFFRCLLRRSFRMLYLPPFYIFWIAFFLVFQAAPFRPHVRTLSLCSLTIISIQLCFNFNFVSRMMSLWNESLLSTKIVYLSHEASRRVYYWCLSLIFLFWYWLIMGKFD